MSLSNYPPGVSGIDNGQCWHLLEWPHLSTYYGGRMLWFAWWRLHLVIDNRSAAATGGEGKGDNRTINRTKCPQEGGGG